jgi:hypothetical protein
VARGEEALKSLRYFWYIVRHKAFVFYAGLKTNAPITLLLIHDWSKLLPSEFVPYRDYFQGNRTEAVHVAWLAAWELHWRRNPHHWNYWSLPCEWLPGEYTTYAMPEQYVREMVADWMGAGRAIAGRWEVREWYEKNKRLIRLHPRTRLEVEALIDAVG